MKSLDIRGITRWHLIKDPVTKVRLLASVTGLLLFVLYLPELIWSERYASLLRWGGAAVLVIFVSAWSWYRWGKSHGEAIVKWLDRHSTGILAFFILGYAVINFYLSYGIRIQNHLGQTSDTGIFEQIQWNTLHGQFFYSSDEKGLHFGVHNSPILVAETPLYAVWQDVGVLFGLQTLALSLAAVPLFVIGRKYLRPSTALICAIAFLLHPSILSQHFTLYEIRLAPLFVLCALYWFDDKYFAGYSVTALLAMMVKENIPLLFLLNGLRSVTQKRSWQWIAMSLLFPLFWFGLSLWIVSQNPNGTGNFLGKHFDYLGHSVGEVVARVLLQPMTIVSNLLSNPSLKLYSLYERLFPFVGLPVGSALSALALPDLGIQFLVREPDAFPIGSNYSNVIVGIFAYSTIFTLAGIRHRHKWLAEQLGYVVLGATLLSLPVTVSPAMFQINSEYTRSVDQVISIVGPQASISAPANLVQAFAKRSLVFNNEYHDRDTVLSTDYVLVDLARVDSAKWMFLQSDPQYEIVFRSTRLVLFRRIK